jgi:hypothetical protein
MIFRKPRKNPKIDPGTHYYSTLDPWDCHHFFLEIGFFLIKPQVIVMQYHKKQQFGSSEKPRDILKNIFRLPRVFRVLACPAMVG